MQIDAPYLHEYLIVGELSLDGSLRPIKGALPISVLAGNKNTRPDSFPWPMPEAAN
jgi:predicted ATPase with chaperone activity